MSPEATRQRRLAATAQLTEDSSSRTPSPLPRPHPLSGLQSRRPLADYAPPEHWPAQQSPATCATQVSAPIPRSNRSNHQVVAREKLSPLLFVRITRFTQIWESLMHLVASILLATMICPTCFGQTIGAGQVSTYLPVT